MKEKYTNHLINQSSPYLLQHAHNPVNWFPWGEEALEKAKKENKLLLISIGYAACHWCHVMEHESFENEEIAAVMNEHFVCIKVDREERPDIDQIYMNAVQLIAGNGGWPLNCFALPDGSPVYGGTYFRPQQWKDILENLALSYKTSPDKIYKAAEEIKKGIKSLDQIIKIEDNKEFSYEDVLDLILKLRKQFDHNNGGNWGAPKFPMSVSYYPLMRYYYHSGDEDIIKHVHLSLQKMADGGIYDHIGGGFARYSVDREWLVPHFEKMLYDNAQLISLYSEAYSINQQHKYKQVVEETIDFMMRDMKSPEGGFYSSYDADSEGVEGKFYLWDKYEIDILLNDKAEIFSDYYNITLDGNWEGRNILNIKTSIQNLVDKYGKSESEILKIINDSKAILFKQREKREKPRLDNKILTSWNALMIKALVDAYLVFDKKEYLKYAINTFEFIENKLLQDNLKLLRNYADGKAKINAFLDDYALLIQSLIALYQASFNEKYIQLAKNITQYTIDHFFDHNTGMFFYTSNDDEALITRSKEVNDNVIPSSNSVMANNLLKLGHYYVNKDYIDTSKQMLINVKDQLSKNPYYMANWFDLMLQFIHKPYEVCILGKDVKKVHKEFNKKFLPNVLLAGGTGDLPLIKDRYTAGRTTIYVCKDNVCKLPVKTFHEALDIIEK